MPTQAEIDRIDKRPHVLRCGACRSENLTGELNEERYRCLTCGHVFTHKPAVYDTRTLSLGVGSVMR